MRTTLPGAFALANAVAVADVVAARARRERRSRALPRLRRGDKDASGAHAYSYDANGNRTDGDAQYDAQDRLLRRAGVTYAYTADGDLALRTDASGRREYTYDARGQLRKVVLPGGKTISYVIDALGRRIAKQVDGKLTQAFVYDLAGRVRGELDASGTLASRFIYGSRPHVPDFLAKNGAFLQLVTDARGSVRLVVDTASGQIVQRLDYDAWGNVLRDTSPGVQPFGFAGGLWDPDAQLVRFGVRDYDPETGRWTANDPIGFGAGQANLYAYVGNDPINAIDPSGLVVETLWDAYSLATGVSNLLESLGCGDYASAAADALGVAMDAYAAAIPLLPGGVGALRQAARGAPKLLAQGTYRAEQFASQKLFDGHFAKHAAEWGAGNITQGGYLKRAQDMLSRGVGGDILGAVRANGDVLRYNVRTNEFAVGTADGFIRTLFRPEKGMEYWLKQVGP